MPRLGLAAARFLRARLPPSSVSASCLSCEGRAEAGTSSRSSPFNSSSPLSRKPISSSARLCVEVEVDVEKFPRFSGTFFRQASSSVVRDRSSSSSSSSYAHASRPLVGYVHLLGSSPGRDPHHDLIVGVNEWVSILGQMPRNRSGLHSFSVVYSNERATTEHDLHDGQQKERAVPNSFRTEKVVVTPSREECEEEETDCVDDGEEFFSGHDNIPAPGNDRRSTTLLNADEAEEVPAGWHASLSTSAEDESDLSELEFVKMDGHPEDLDDGELEAGDGRPEEEEETLWTGSILERVALKASTEKEESTSELSSESLDVASSADEDSRDGGLTESEPHGVRKAGFPYLHTLSVDEVREILEKARARDVRILHVRKCCEWVDHLVFASGRSCRHLLGMADALVYEVKQQSESVGPNSFPLVEGRDGERWMVVDCGNIVIHLFSEEARSYYNLEEFWTKKSNPRLVETY